MQSVLFYLSSFLQIMSVTDRLKWPRYNLSTVFRQVISQRNHLTTVISLALVWFPFCMSYRNKIQYISRSTVCFLVSWYHQSSADFSKGHSWWSVTALIGSPQGLVYIDNSDIRLFWRLGRPSIYRYSWRVWWQLYWNSYHILVMLHLKWLVFFHAALGSFVMSVPTKNKIR